MMCLNHQEKCSMMDSRSASRTPPPRAWGGAGRGRRGECHMWLRGTGPGAVTMTTIAGEDTMSSNLNTMHCIVIELHVTLIYSDVCWVHKCVLFSLVPAVSSYANKGFSPDRVHNQTRSKPCQGLSQVESIWLNTFPLRSLLINFQMKTLKTIWSWTPESLWKERILGRCNKWPSCVNLIVFRSRDLYWSNLQYQEFIQDLKLTVFFLLVM